jgi:hypothetical protein
MIMMRRFLPLALICLGLTGCGGGPVVVKGNILLNDQPLRLEEREQATVTFSEMRADGKGATFPTALNPDGTFVIVGYYRKGIPEGKYRVSLFVRFADPAKPRYNLQAYGPENSPWIVEVHSGMPEVPLTVNSP